MALTRRVWSRWFLVVGQWERRLFSGIEHGTVATVLLDGLHIGGGSSVVIAPRRPGRRGHRRCGNRRADDSSPSCRPGLSVALLEEVSGGRGDHRPYDGQGHVASRRGVSPASCRPGARRRPAYAAANQWAVAEVARLAAEVDCDWVAAPAYTYTNDPAQLEVIEQRWPRPKRQGSRSRMSQETSVSRFQCRLR